jgi:hypothetical protein
VTRSVQSFDQLDRTSRAHTSRDQGRRRVLPGAPLRLDPGIETDDSLDPDVSNEILVVQLDVDGNVADVAMESRATR